MFEPIIRSVSSRFSVLNMHINCSRLGVGAKDEFKEVSDVTDVGYHGQPKLGGEGHATCQDTAVPSVLRDQLKSADENTARREAEQVSRSCI